MSTSLATVDLLGDLKLTTDQRRVHERLSGPIAKWHKMIGRARVFTPLQFYCPREPDERC